MSLEAVFGGIGRFSVRFRFVVVLFWIAVAVLATKQLPSLTNEITTNNSAFLPSDLPSIKATNLAAPLLGGLGTSEIQIIGVRSSGLTSADTTAMSNLAVSASHIKHVLSATELDVSTDGKAEQLNVMDNIDAHDFTRQSVVVSALQSAINEMHAPAGLQVHTAGQVATSVAEQNSSNNSTKTVQAVSVLFIIVLLLIVLRSPLAAVVTLLPAVFALLISFRLIGEMGASGIKISQICQVLVITLLLGAGTDYGLFLVFRVREERNRGAEGRDAILAAMVRVGESITASAGTVILALLTLLFASYGMYHDLGLPLAAGIAVMLAVGLTLLPALLAIFGNAVFWPARFQPRNAEGTWAKIAGAVMQRPKLALIVGVIGFSALALAVTGYSPSGFASSNTAPAGTDVAAGNALTTEYFPQASSNPAYAVFKFPSATTDNLTRVSTAESSLKGSGEFATLHGPLDATSTVLTASQFQQLSKTLGPADKLPLLEPHSDNVSQAQYAAYRSSSSYISADDQLVQFEATLKVGGRGPRRRLTRRQRSVV